MEDLVVWGHIYHLQLRYILILFILHQIYRFIDISQSLEDKFREAELMKEFPSREGHNSTRKLNSWREETSWIL